MILIFCVAIHNITIISNKTIVNNVYELTEKFEIERMMPGHSKEELIELMKNIYGEELNQKQIVCEQ